MLALAVSLRHAKRNVDEPLTTSASEQLFGATWASLEARAHLVSTYSLGRFIDHPNVVFTDGLAAYLGRGDP